MADLSDIRAALAACFSSLEDDVQVSAYMLEAPTPPAVFVFPAEIDYDLSMHRGLDKWLFTIQAVVNESIDRGGQVNLDEFLAPSGPRSIKQLVEADTTLGGVVQAARVVSCTGYRKYVSDGPPRAVHLGAEWSVEVYSSGTA